MRHFITPIIGLFLVLGCKPSNEKHPESASKTEDPSTIFRVAFGSCNKQFMTNPFWDDILAQEPDVWIWGGDNIYADTEDMEKLKSMYAQQNSIKGYAELKSKVPVIGTWDDHDYGLNDGGEEFSMKKESQQQFLDFMGVSQESEQRKREGIYASHEFETLQGKVKVLVLDTRYFRSGLEKDPSPNRRYKPNNSEDATVLGNAQWTWLQKELQSSDSDFNLIVTSIQLLSAEHGFETWGNFPKEMDKMFETISESKAKGVMILSGDRHLSEFSRTSIAGMAYPLIDFTSSGLTHKFSKFTSEVNKHRVGEVIAETSFGIIELHLGTKKAHFKIMGENGVVYQELKQTY